MPVTYDRIQVAPTTYNPEVLTERLVWHPNAPAFDHMFVHVVMFDILRTRDALDTLALLTSLVALRINLTETLLTLRHEVDNTMKHLYDAMDTSSAGLRSGVRLAGLVGKAGGAIATKLVPRPISFDHVNHPSTHHLRQQTPDTILHVPLFAPQRRAYHLRANRTRLPELDQEAIKVEPLPKIRFPDGLLDICIDADASRVVRHMDRDL